MPESLPGLIKGNLFRAGGWGRKETVGRGSSIAMHWAEPGCAPRAKSRRGSRECWRGPGGYCKPRGLASALVLAERPGPHAAQLDGVEAPRAAAS